MAILKCKMCGGDIQTTDNTYGTCESCGTTSTLPKANDEKVINLFNRANHFRRLNEFDKALTAYENILNEDNTNAEAHWCTVLCRYGIEYVEDSQTHKRIPTFRWAQFEPILDDLDYLAALEYAPDEYTKSLYEEEANKINEIQKTIIEVSSKEKPYDVFICYKETTDGGSRTKDSQIAEDIYHQLIKENFRVFFARITLKDSPGQQYEPLIFSAINSAKVMVVIGTCKEHFDAVWVRNEWSRFSSLSKKDNSRLLIPCFQNIDPYDLPGELGILQSFDMSKLGFLPDLIRGIKKILDTNISNGTASVPTLSKAIPPALLKRYRDEERKLKEEQRNLQTGVKSAERDVASLEASLREYERKRDALHEKRTAKAQEIRVTYGYDPRSAVDEAFKFYQYESDSLQSSISSYRDGLYRSQDTLRKNENRLNEIDGILDLSLEERIDDYFDKLCSEKESVSTESAFLELTKKFEEFGGYKGANKLVGECSEKAREAVVKEREAAEKAIKSQYQTLIRRKYNARTEDEYQNLAKQFRSMDGYENTNDLANECEQLAVNAKYDLLVKEKNNATTEKEYQSLAQKFRAMKGYQNAAEFADECDNQYRTLKQKREENERIEKQRRDEQERIESEQKAIQEKKDHEERERREAEERERWRIEAAARKAAELRKRIFGVVSFILAIVALIFCFSYPFSYAISSGSIVWPMITFIFFLRVFFKPREATAALILGITISIIGIFYVLNPVNSILYNLMMVTAFFMAYFRV